MKIKPCKLCGGKRVGNLTICYKCFLKRERTKRNLKIAKLKERKKTKKEKKLNSYGHLKKVAGGLFSIFIRREKADENGIVQCYTCPKKLHWKKMNAGHYWHGKLDFDRRNLHPQCSQCNSFNSGNLAVYGTKLAQELGADGIKQLELDANTKIYSWTELKQIIETYQKKIKELSK